MKANISDLKKIVKPMGGTPPPSSDDSKKPKNIETLDGEDDDEFDDEFDDELDGEEGEEGDGEEGDGEEGDVDQKGAGKGKGEEFKEIDAKVPQAKYEVTPWKPTGERTVIGEVLPTGTLGDSDDPTDKNAEEVKDKWKDITTSATSQSQGKIPGGIKRALARMNAPVVDWRKELEVFIDDAISKSKYTLPSRRFLGTGKAQYGYKKYKEDFECVVVAIDTSGSISDKMVAQFLGEVKSIVDNYSPQDLYIIFCHTRNYRIDHIEPGQPIEVGKLQSGGTEFWPPFKWTEENLLDKGIVPSVFLYFTDGEATFPNPGEYGIGEYEDKCIWVLLTFNGEKYRNEVPFGNRIDITLPNEGITDI